MKNFMIIILFLGMFNISSLVFAQNAVKIFNNKDLLNREGQEIEMPSFPIAYTLKILKIIKGKKQLLKKKNQTYSNKQKGMYYLYQGNIYLEVLTPQGWIYTLTTLDENRYAIKNKSYDVAVVFFYIENFDIYLSIAISHYPAINDKSNTPVIIKGDISKLIDKFPPLDMSKEEVIKKIVKEMILDKFLE